MTSIQYGDYELLEPIGAGGMAQVFLARHHTGDGEGRLVAIKRVYQSLVADEDFFTMFVDEARIARQLSHANIAETLELGNLGDIHYMVIEHVHGRDLKRVFRRCRRRRMHVPISVACRIVMGVLDGLDYAHRFCDESGTHLELVHRDVSLQNVLVSFEGAVKLIDFGVAKAVGRATQTRAGLVKGKFAYMSPEQLRALPVDGRSDLFSLGTVLFEMLTGRRLFYAEDTMQTVKRVRDAQVVPPRAYRKQIPPELEQILLKALAKHASDRFQSARSFCDALASFVHTSGHACSRQQLAGWMAALFAEEAISERAKYAEYLEPEPDSDELEIEIVYEDEADERADSAESSEESAPCVASDLEWAAGLRAAPEFAPRRALPDDDTTRPETEGFVRRAVAAARSGSTVVGWAPLPARRHGDTTGTIAEVSPKLGLVAQVQQGQQDGRIAEADHGREAEALGQRRQHEHAVEQRQQREAVAGQPAQHRMPHQAAVSGEREQRAAQQPGQEHQVDGTARGVGNWLAMCGSILAEEGEKARVRNRAQHSERKVEHCECGQSSRALAHVRAVCHPLHFDCNPD